MMPPVPPSSFAARGTTAVFTFVVVTAILYFGREVLIPLGLSVLLSFLLAPAVRQLERLHLPRVVATTLVALLSFGVLAGVFAVAGTQFLHLAASLPEYKNKIQTKVSNIRAAP
jgi:predicted PurR-regulated permease PerM